ncbi:unnamed protein product, partial [Gulo gulo]
VLSSRIPFISLDSVFWKDKRPVNNILSSRTLGSNNAFPVSENILIR